MSSQYEERNAMELDRLGGFYTRHVVAMTKEGLNSKADIAAELGYRDMVIDQQQSEINALKAQVERLRSIVASLKSLADSYFNRQSLEDYDAKRLEHDAEVARVAYLACAEEYGLAYAHASKEGIERSANQYAQRIKAGDL